MNLTLPSLHWPATKVRSLVWDGDAPNCRCAFADDTGITVIRW